MELQWLALLPHSEQDSGFSVWLLCDLSVSARVPYGYSGFLPQPKVMQVG